MFEEIYQAQFKPLQDAYPLHSEVFSNGKVYKVVDWGFDNNIPHLVGVDREGNEITLTTFEAVTYKVCTRCGGSGRYSYNMRDGSVCYGCSGVGKNTLAPTGFPQKLKKMTCIENWLKFGYKIGDEMKGEFCGFSKTGGTPLYQCTNKRTSETTKLLYSYIIKRFE